MESIPAPVGHVLKILEIHWFLAAEYYGRCVPLAGTVEELVREYGGGAQAQAGEPLGRTLVGNTTLTDNYSTATVGPDGARIKGRGNTVADSSPTMSSDTGTGARDVNQWTRLGGGDTLTSVCSADQPLLQTSHRADAGCSEYVKNEPRKLLNRDG